MRNQVSSDVLPKFWWHTYRSSNVCYFQGMRWVNLSSNSPVVDCECISSIMQKPRAFADVRSWKIQEGAWPWCRKGDHRVQHSVMRSTNTSKRPCKIIIPQRWVHHVAPCKLSMILTVISIIFEHRDNHFLFSFIARDLREASRLIEDCFSRPNGEILQLRCHSYAWYNMGYPHQRAASIVLPEEPKEPKERSDKINSRWREKRRPFQEYTTVMLIVLNHNAKGIDTTKSTPMHLHIQLRGWVRQNHHFWTHRFCHRIIYSDLVGLSRNRHSSHIHFENGRY